MKTRFVSRRRAVLARLSMASAALAALSPAWLHAQPQGVLEEVVVTATRSPQRLSEVLADVTVLDAAAIQRSGAAALTDLLARLPGLEVQRNGGVGGVSTVYVRGGESRFTAVYIDGVRVDSQSTGGATWESIPLGLIDRVEVLRGPAAAVYGSDALSGVIQIFTRRGEGAFTPYLGAGVGSQGLRRLEAGFSGGDGGLDYAISLSGEDGDGFNARPVAGQNPDIDGHQSQSASLRLGWRVNPAHRLEWSYLVNMLDAQYDQGLGRDDVSEHVLRTAAWGWSAQWTPVWAMRLSASASHSRYKTLPAPSYLTVTDLSNLLWHNEFSMGRHRVTADLERKQDKLENVPIDQDRHQNAVALGYGFAGERHSAQFNLRHDDDSEFGGQSTASAAYGYALSPQWRVTASAANAFRAPTLYQRFSDYGLASLKPETSDNLEFGVRYTRGGSHAGLVLYRNKVTDLINFSGPGGCVSSYGCYANTARAVYQGLTLSGSHRMGDTVLGASLDVQDPHDAITGRQLARRARQHATLSADTRWGGWTLGAQWQLSGKRFDNAANTVVLGGYGLVHLRASTALARDWSLVLSADNLGDKAYALANGFATAGRTLYAGVKWAPR